MIVKWVEKYLLLHWGTYLWVTKNYTSVTLLFLWFTISSYLKSYK